MSINKLKTVETSETVEPQEHEKQNLTAEFRETHEKKSERIRVGFALTALALLIGLIVGLVVWASLWATSMLTALIWDNLGNLVGGAIWFPVIVCSIGGVIIGLWDRFFGSEIKPLSEVMGTVKDTGGYKITYPIRFIVSYLLPFIFGGSIGPEAGMVGFFTAGATWIGDSLKKAGKKIASISEITVSAVLTAIFATPFLGIVLTAQDSMHSEIDDKTEHVSVQEAIKQYDYDRKVKVVLYTASAIGAFCGIRLSTYIFGSPAGFPSFGSIVFSPMCIPWAAVCIIAGYILAIAFHASSKIFGSIGKKLEKHVVLRATIAGLVLGIAGMFLPYVLFAGQLQTRTLMVTYTEIGVGVLVATAFVKIIITPMLLNMSWRGGQMFPVFFSGFCLGYAIALISGVDPILCACVTAAAAGAAIARNPIIPIMLLCMCFGIPGILWIGLAAIIGFAIPMPKVLGIASAADMAKGIKAAKAEKKTETE